MPVAVIAAVCDMVISAFGCGWSAIVITAGLMASRNLQGHKYIALGRPVSLVKRNAKSAWLHDGNVIGFI
jgi:hypothetical protein